MAKKTWSRIALVARCIAVPLLGLELLYLLAANIFLFSGALQHAVRSSPGHSELSWTSAYSPWPGRAYVSGFRLSMQDPAMEFCLSIARAKVDIVLPELLRRRFHAVHVRAEGVSYRFLTKVDGTSGKELRLAAFPPIEAFPRPALRPNPMPAHRTAAQIDALWSVQLDDVDATLTELWFLEYRYHGAGRVQGGFALAPLRTLQVGPALLQLEGGELGAGDHVISSSFTARAQVTIARADVSSLQAPHVVHTLTTSIRLEAPIENLEAASLYVSDLGARGTGRVSADLQIARGRLMPGSSLEAWLYDTVIQLEGYRFSGDTHARLSVSNPGTPPTVRDTLTGMLSVPLGKGAAVATLSEVSAELVLADDDLSHGVSLQWLRAVLGEARVRDARTVTAAVGDLVPVVAPMVMGNGPLIASAAAYVTPDYAVIRLDHLRLGDAEVEGAAVRAQSGWNGAAAGHLGPVPLGFRLHNSKLEGVPFVPDSWLSAELRKAGIEPPPQRSGRSRPARR